MKLKNKVMINDLKVERNRVISRFMDKPNPEFDASGQSEKEKFYDDWNKIISVVQKIKQVSDSKDDYNEIMWSLEKLDKEDLINKCFVFVQRYNEFKEK